MSRSGSGNAAHEVLRVLVAAASTQVRHEVETALRADGRFTVCCEAGDAAAAVALALVQQPDICVLEVEMPGTGVSAAWEISQQQPETTIVMLADSASDDDLLASLRAGANGYLPKDVSRERLPFALWDAHRGEAALPRALMGRVITLFRDRGPTWRRLAHNSARLSTREWQVLDLLRQHVSHRDIAEQLMLAPATVRSHRARIVRKLRAAGQQDLIEQIVAAEDISSR